MSKGDINDIHSRLKALLPADWFSNNNTILDGALMSCACYLSWCYQIYKYARLQTRINSASDGWLDIAARDFFGSRLRRDEGMSDDELRKLIRKNLFRERATRQAICGIIEELTGQTPQIIEPQCAADTGGYGVPASGYGMAGHYGSQQIPCQAFVIVSRPSSANSVLDTDTGMTISVDESPSVMKNRDLKSPLVVTDKQIFAAVAAAKMEGTIAWVKVQ